MLLLKSKILPWFKEHVGIFLVLAVMFLNLYYMHDAVVASVVDFIPSVLYSKNVYIGFDIAVILLFFSVLTLGKRKYAYTCTYFLLLVWELVNIIYSRFFNQYFIISALNEVSNFEGNWWHSYLGEAFRISDSIFLLATLLVCYEIFIRKSSRRVWNGRVCWYCIAPLPLLIVMLHVFVGLPVLYGEKYEADSLRDYWVQNNDTALAYSFIYDQEKTVFEHGLVRTQFYCNIFNYSPREEISEQDICDITRFLQDKYSNEAPVLPESYGVDGQRNIVFVVVESWLSSVVGLELNGMEITPNLNRLAKAEGTYFNGRMRNNKTIGESSDAQLLYFSGLCPIANTITISEILNTKQVTLPGLLKNRGYSTHITIPTRKYFWHQAEANRVYGLDSCYSTVKKDGDNMSPDREVFELAYIMQKKMRQPFMHVILTAAMHGPYTWAIPGVELDESIRSDEYSDEYINYLQKCHYTDSELGKYIRRLKQDGTFDNTLFIIAADHAPNIKQLNVCPQEVSNADIPLMIVNAAIDTTKTVTETINQLDVFPSLLDLLQIRSTWRGLGYSIFRKANFKGDISDETRRVSEKIIYGNYFERAQYSDNHQ